MWVIILVLFTTLFVIEEKVKHRVLQPILFFMITVLMACTFVYGPTWLENLI